AGRVRLLDLGGLLAREGDLLLLLLVAMHLAQIVEEPRLVLLRDRVLPRLLLHAGSLQLLDKKGERELQLLGELGDVRLGHCLAILLASAALRPAPIP